MILGSITYFVLFPLKLLCLLVTWRPSTDEKKQRAVEEIDNLPTITAKLVTLLKETALQTVIIRIKRTTADRGISSVQVKSLSNAKPKTKDADEVVKVDETPDSRNNKLLSQINCTGTCSLVVEEVINYATTTEIPIPDLIDEEDQITNRMSILEKKNLSVVSTKASINIVEKEDPSMETPEKKSIQTVPDFTNKLQINAANRESPPSSSIDKNQVTTSTETLLCSELSRMTISEKTKATIEESVDGLIEELASLDIKNRPQSLIDKEEITKWLSRPVADDFELEATKAVGARATDFHRSLPPNGGHAHSFLACYHGKLMDEAQAKRIGGIPIKVIDALEAMDDRLGQSVSLDYLVKQYLTKKQDRLLKKDLPNMYTDKGKERLLRYLRDGKCPLGVGAVEGPWYGARSFAHLPLWPPEEEINGADVCQGDIDNCYFACGLLLAAEHYPTSLMERIVRIDDKENMKSRFLVRHWSERRGGCISPNPKSQKGPNLTEVGDTFYAFRRVNRKGGPGTPLYCRSRSGAIYPMVLERAFQKYRSRGGDGGSYEDVAGKNCLEAEAVLHFLTGLKFNQIKLAEDSQRSSPNRRQCEDQNKNKIWELICSALQKGRAVSTGTYSMGTRRNEKLPEEWIGTCLVPDHNYALLDAGTDSVHGRFVVLRNPFGKQQSPFTFSSVEVWPKEAAVPPVVDEQQPPEQLLEEDAVFRLGLTYFFSYFETISYATETCQRYPIRRCHRYRPFFADNEDIEWCYKISTPLLHEDKQEEENTLAPRRLEYECELSKQFSELQMR